MPSTAHVIEGFQDPCQSSVFSAASTSQVWLEEELGNVRSSKSKDQGRKVPNGSVLCYPPLNTRGAANSLQNWNN